MKLHQLIKTMNFESAAYTVFQRLILGEGPGLLVLWGGEPGEPVKANKTYFLDTVDAFQEGATPAKPYVSPLLWKLLALLAPGHYQCVSVIGDCPPSQKAKIYETPLGVATTLALAGAAHRKGLTAGRNIVLLCDDIQEFMRCNKLANEQFLRDLATSLDSQTTVTFLGASQLTWNAKGQLGSERVLPLGWD